MLPVMAPPYMVKVPSLRTPPPQCAELPVRLPPYMVKVALAQL